MSRVIGYKQIGFRIKNARTKKKYTQEYVSECCNITPQHMSNIENGKTKVSLPTLIAIANCIEVSIDELLSDVIDKSEVVINKEIKDLLLDCDKSEVRYLIDVLRSSKQLLRKHKDVFNHQQEM